MGKPVEFPKNGVPALAPAPPVDALATFIEESHRGLFALREENAGLRADGARDASTIAMLESEIECLKAQLESERAERRHYHSLANEIITRLDVVGATIDDVVKRAEQEVYRQRKENPRAELPEIKLPKFLERGAAALTDPASHSLQEDGRAA